MGISLLSFFIFFFHFNFYHQASLEQLRVKGGKKKKVMTQSCNTRPRLHLVTRTVVDVSGVFPPPPPHLVLSCAGSKFSALDKNPRNVGTGSRFGNWEVGRASD